MAYTFNPLTGNFDYYQPATPREPVGTAQLDFGPIGSSGNITSVAVSLPAITATNRIETQLRLEATADHTIDELIYDPIRIFASIPNAGVGFTIWGQMPTGSAYGKYLVDWELVGT